MKSSRAISSVSCPYWTILMMMMMMIEMVLETSAQYRHLTQLIAREDFIEFSRSRTSVTSTELGSTLMWMDDSGRHDRGQSYCGTLQEVCVSFPLYANCTAYFILKRSVSLTWAPPCGAPGAPVPTLKIRPVIAKVSSWQTCTATVFSLLKISSCISFLNLLLFLCCLFFPDMPWHVTAPHGVPPELVFSER
jgi:hypothetical protein